MKGLILETSTEKGCLILSHNKTPIASELLPDGPLLSKTLASKVDILIKTHSFQPEFIAVGTGPGSYTGVRVGAALAQALGFGWNIPVFGFCSLQAFVPQNTNCFAVLVDARIGGVYVLTHQSPTPALVAVTELEKTLSSIDLCISPHPTIIQKRISLTKNWIEASPDIESLSALSYNLFLQEKATPLVLSYLSSP